MSGGTDAEPSPRRGGSPHDRLPTLKSTGGVGKHEALSLFRKRAVKALYLAEPEQTVQNLNSLFVTQARCHFRNTRGALTMSIRSKKGEQVQGARNPER